MDRPALLDVNVLIALFDPEHVHHELAHDWFSDNRRDGWATCPVTENGFLRVLSNPAYRAALHRLPDLTASLRTFCGDPHHRFWSDAVSLRYATLFDPALIGGHRQLTDIYLLLGPLQDAGNTTTLSRYLDLLADAGLLAGLSKYARSSPLRGSSPKLNVLNTALMTAGSGYAFDEARADRTYWGRIVESAVGAHLLNTATADIRVYYWRDSGGHEVDFVLERGPQLVGIEVKSGPMRRAPRGLETFEERFKPRRTLVVGEGGVPLNEFLAAPAGQWCEEG